MHNVSKKYSGRQTETSTPKFPKGHLQRPDKMRSKSIFDPCGAHMTHTQKHAPITQSVQPLDYSLSKHMSKYAHDAIKSVKRKLLTENLCIFMTADQQSIEISIAT